MTKRYHPAFNPEDANRTIAHFDSDGNVNMLDDGRPNAARFDGEDGEMNDADAEAFFEQLLTLLSGVPGQQIDGDGDHILICSGEPEPYDAATVRPHTARPVPA